MKLIIDIPDNIYEWVKNTGKFGMYRFDTAKVIRNGIPLDDVKAEILDYNIRQRVSGSESFLMGYCAGMDKSAKILDNIGKAERED